MNGWDFDWVFGLGSVVVIAVLVAIRAYATGFFTKAGEHGRWCMNRRLEAIRGPGPVGARWATISA